MLPATCYLQVSLSPLSGVRRDSGNHPLLDFSFLPIHKKMLFSEEQSSQIEYSAGGHASL